jgi:hypothetical protein
MGLDVVALVLATLVRGADVRCVMRMALDVLVDPSLAVLILHRTSSFRTFFRTFRNLHT